jgi:hypothetical protein
MFIVGGDEEPEQKRLGSVDVLPTIDRSQLGVAVSGRF